MCVRACVHATEAEGYACFSGSRRGRPKREENQEEKPKEDGSEQETTNDAANDKSDGKPGVSQQSRGVYVDSNW